MAHDSLHKLCEKSLVLFSEPGLLIGTILWGVQSPKLSNVWQARDVTRGEPTALAALDYTDFFLLFPFLLFLFWKEGSILHCMPNVDFDLVDHLWKQLFWRLTGRTAVYLSLVGVLGFLGKGTFAAMNSVEESGLGGSSCHCQFPCRFMEIQLPIGARFQNISPLSFMSCMVLEDYEPLSGLLFA